MNGEYIVKLVETIFTGFDNAILNALHHLATTTNNLLTPFFVFISYFADKGIGLVILSLILICYRKTRKYGICMLLAIVVGAISTNVILKNWIARERMFSDITSKYYAWWTYVGSHMEESFSFPSGHVTATMACMTALFLSLEKGKKRWLCFSFVILMALSRMYLMVHYPSDVLGAIIIGGTAAIIADFFTDKLYLYANNNSKLNQIL